MKCAKGSTILLYLKTSNKTSYVIKQQATEKLNDETAGNGKQTTADQTDDVTTMIINAITNMPRSVNVISVKLSNKITSKTVL